MKTRPCVVAAHRVAVSEATRARATTLPAWRRGMPRARSAVVARARCQVRRTRRADPDEVTAGRVRTGGRELRAVRFEECLVAAPNPGSARRSESLGKSFPRCRTRIGDDRRVELQRLPRSATIGPLAMTHFGGSPFWKFTSWKSR